MIFSVGRRDMDQEAVKKLNFGTAEHFNASLRTFPLMPGADSSAAFSTGVYDIRGRDWLIFHIANLDEKICPSLDLALKFITETDFSAVNMNWTRDIKPNIYNYFQSPSTGVGFANCFSSRLLSKNMCANELWHGPDQFLFRQMLKKLNIFGVTPKLKAIQEKLIKAGVLIHITGETPEKTLKEATKLFAFLGPPKSCNPDSQDLNKFIALSKIKSSPGNPMVLSLYGLQHGSASVSVKAAPCGSPLQGAELVLSNLLSTGALYKNIRVKGGAYEIDSVIDRYLGAFFIYSGYDPNPGKSLAVFTDTLKKPFAVNFPGCKEILDRAVIGAYALETCPISPRDKCLEDFYHFLTGAEDNHCSQLLQSIVDVTPEKIDAALERLAAEIDSWLNYFQPVIVAGEKEAEKAAKQLGVYAVDLYNIYDL